MRLRCTLAITSNHKHQAFPITHRHGRKARRWKIAHKYWVRSAKTKPLNLLVHNFTEYNSFPLATVNDDSNIVRAASLAWIADLPREQARRSMAINCARRSVDAGRSGIVIWLIRQGERASPSRNQGTEDSFSRLYLTCNNTFLRLLPSRRQPKISVSAHQPHEPGLNRTSRSIHTNMS